MATGSTQFIGISSDIDLTERKSTQVNDQTEVVTLDDIKDYISGYTETIVNISSAQILEMGTSGCELLPAPSANSYYDVNKIIIEYTHNTTAYTLADLYIGLTLQFPAIGSYLLTGGIDQAYVISGSASDVEVADGVIVAGNSLLGAKLSMYTWDGNNPTLGNGTMRVKVYHKTITFGA